MTKNKEGLKPYKDVIVRLNFETGEIIVPEENKEVEKWFQKKLHALEGLRRFDMQEFIKLYDKHHPHQKGDGCYYLDRDSFAEEVCSKFGQPAQARGMDENKIIKILSEYHSGDIKEAKKIATAIATAFREGRL